MAGGGLALVQVHGHGVDCSGAVAVAGCLRWLWLVRLVGRRGLDTMRC